jgi:hypothetical protein
VTKILSMKMCYYVEQYKKCLLYTMSNLIRKVERIPKKSCIIQEIIRKMGEGRKWKNVNNEEGNRAEL